MSQPMPENRRHDFLDVARALAAVMVLIEHFRWKTWPLWFNWPLTHFNIGMAGIILFLAISGYIIPASLERGKSLGQFWLRRAFRLLPALYASMLLAVGYLCLVGPTAWLSPLSDGWAWAGNLVMAPDLFGRPYTWGVYWSLRLELLVYASAAALHAMGWLRRAGHLAVLLPAFVLTMGLWRPLAGATAWDPNSYRLAVLTALLGVLAYCHHQGEVSRATFLLTVAGLFASATAVLVMNSYLYPAHAWDVALCGFLATWGAALVPFTALVLLRDWEMPAWACYLGRISYSVYLCHPFVILALLAWAQTWLFLPAFLVLTLLIAVAGYHLVEKPGIALGQALEKWLWPGASPVPCHGASPQAPQEGPKSRAAA